MSSDNKVWIGADPGGKSSFGLAIIEANGNVLPSSYNCAEDAVKRVQEYCKNVTPAGVGVDAPLWWSLASGADRKADKYVRKQIVGKKDVNGRTTKVLTINSLTGSAIAQGLIFVQRLRLIYPDVFVTETHPKAALVHLGNAWSNIFAAIPNNSVKLNAHPDHERDALVSAIIARECMQKSSAYSWTDLSLTRDQTEEFSFGQWQNPVHYFWPN